MSKHVIAVVGATGAQGGGLARAIAEKADGRFRVRAITRSPGGERARALAAGGAEIVTADLDDPESLERAFAGAHGVFCVTNFWEHFSPARETEQASNMARAAKKAHVEHVVWSTLEDTRKLVAPDDVRVPTLMGTYKVPHTDAKADADAVFRELRRSVLGIFERGRELVGERIGLAGEVLTGVQLAEGLSRGLGEPVRWAPPSVDAFRAMMRHAPLEALGKSTGFSAADDTANMFQVLVDHEAFFLERSDVERTRALNPSLESFDAWVARAFSRGAA